MVKNCVTYFMDGPYLFKGYLKSSPFVRPFTGVSDDLLITGDGRFYFFAHHYFRGFPSSSLLTDLTATSLFYCIPLFRYLLSTKSLRAGLRDSLILLSSLPSAVPTMRLSQDSSRLPFCLFFFGRFTSPGSFWIFFSFRSSLT